MTRDQIIAAVKPDLEELAAGAVGIAQGHAAALLDALQGPTRELRIQAQKIAKYIRFDDDRPAEHFRVSYLAELGQPVPDLKEVALSGAKKWSADNQPDGTATGEYQADRALKLLERATKALDEGRWADLRRELNAIPPGGSLEWVMGMASVLGNIQ